MPALHGRDPKPDDPHPAQLPMSIKV